MLTRNGLASYAANGRRAYGLVDTIFADTVVALRKDSRFNDVLRSDFELLLADARRNAELLLMHEQRDRVHLDDIGEDI
jgi:hypothetical protein